jgi:hypothetical protein
MQMLVVVLNRIEKLNDLLLELSNKNIVTGTIIDSSGMAKTLVECYPNSLLFGSLRTILGENRPFNKTIFMVLPDEKVPVAMECVRKVASEIKGENVGVMFTLPVNHFESLNIQGS